MKYFKWVFFFGIFQFVISSKGFAQSVPVDHQVISGISQERLDRYSQFLQTEIDKGQIAGAVSMVFRKEQVISQQSLGFQDINSRSPMVADQLFFIQSMTKPIISVAFMMLYEEGHFLLSDPVSKYIPAFDSLMVSADPSVGSSAGSIRLNKPVTIHQLLSHTAGFSHGLGGTALDKEIVQALYLQPHKDIASRVNALLQMPLVGQPGDQWYYSASPDVLSLLIEKFSGMNTAQFLKSRIFDPLKMDDTGYNVSKEKQPRLAHLHQLNDIGKLVTSERQPPMEGNTVYGGTHGLFSTASDYLKFCRMLLNQGQLNGIQILSPKTIQLMTLNHVDDLYTSPGQGFGLGFGITTDVADSKAVGSPGQYYWSGAYCTYFFIDPEEELIAILMTQTAPYSNYYGQKMRQYIYQAIVD